jgi:hypothetical protein
MTGVVPALWAAQPDHAAAETPECCRKGTSVAESSPRGAWEGERRSENFVAVSARRGAVGFGRAMATRSEGA